MIFARRHSMFISLENFRSLLLNARLVFTGRRIGGGGGGWRLRVRRDYDDEERKCQIKDEPHRLASNPDRFQREQTINLAALSELFSRRVERKSPCTARPLALSVGPSVGRSGRDRSVPMRDRARQAKPDPVRRNHNVVPALVRPGARPAEHHQLSYRGYPDRFCLIPSLPSQESVISHSTGNHHEIVVTYATCLLPDDESDRKTERQTPTDRPIDPSIHRATLSE